MGNGVSWDCQSGERDDIFMFSDIQMGDTHDLECRLFGFFFLLWFLWVDLSVWIWVADCTFAARISIGRANDGMSGTGDVYIFSSLPGTDNALESEEKYRGFSKSIPGAGRRSTCVRYRKFY